MVAQPYTQFYSTSILSRPTKARGPFLLVGGLVRENTLCDDQHGCVETPPFTMTLFQGSPISCQSPGPAFYFFSGLVREISIETIIVGVSMEMRICLLSP